MSFKINKIDIQKAIKNSKKLRQILQEPFKIEIVNDSDNKVFKIKGNIEVYAKIGLTGWGKYEFDTLTQLSTKNYNVPKPITYVSYQKEIKKDLTFGNLEREVGILFYFPIKGENLEQHLTKINIKNALNFLKRLHQDKSLSNGVIENYQKVEVNRGLLYIRKLFKGKFANQLEEWMKRYENLDINYCFIHGGPRLEHFIINNDQIGMIDFEGACIGDAFKDLGIFFTELLFHNIEKEELIKNYFNRKLTEEENIRLHFFELRALLVKKKFEPKRDVIGYIQKIINDV